MFEQEGDSTVFSSVLCPSLPSAIFGLRTGGNELWFQVSSLYGQLAGKVEWMTRNLLLSRDGF